MLTVSSPQAYELFHEGALTLAQMEHNGIRMDVDYLDGQITKVEKKVTRLKEVVREDSLYRTWRKTYGAGTNVGSTQQLAHMLFKVLGHQPKSFTDTGLPKMDKSTLEDYKAEVPIIAKYLEAKKWEKVLSTYLKGIAREIVDGILHPFYNLHTVKTFRSSSDSPNFQNIPIRDPEIGKLIRQAFIPRDGRVLVEVDFGALEFRIAACFWKDPLMIRYASDPDKDIHRDAAAKCYMCKPEQVSKAMRGEAKNKFVFPILYGSYYVSCCQDLWFAAQDPKLCLVDGTPVLAHLKAKGIRGLGDCVPRERPRPGTFEEHVQGVEGWFNNSFPRFRADKDKWWDKYQERGWFPLMTGFVVHGVYPKNFLMNCPVQGPGFHCLLWCINAIRQELRRRKMKSLLVGQIHDCVLGDVPLPEYDEFMEIVVRTMVKELRKAWDWVVTPILVEADVVPPGGNWYQKAKVEV